ncbi:MAG: hypothetical protein R3E12_12165 [Candidatus Eisenbacteria bacterium]
MRSRRQPVRRGFNNAFEHADTPQGEDRNPSRMARLAGKPATGDSRAGGGRRWQESGWGDILLEMDT